MLSRRCFLGGVSAVPLATPVFALASQPPPDPWYAWLDDLRVLQAQVRRRGWTLAPLTVSLPATEAAIARVEAAHQLAVPPQLRALLTGRAARVGFGWALPPLMRPFPGADLPGGGGLRDTLWDLAHIDETAIPGFSVMRKNLAGETDAEEPNRPEMWENQFPFASLDNGDALTIDVSSPAGQPVRYFSQDLEGLHGRALAPDLVSFLTTYIELGCAGSDQDDWFRFVTTNDGERAYLDADGEGARRWRAFLSRDPAERGPDEPPPPVPARTRSDFNLLDAARDGSLWGLDAALAAGAAPDCVDGTVPNRQGTYATTFETALVFAVRRGEIATVERLLGAGAALDTRLLAASEAIRAGAVETLHWLLARGARANGWAGDRAWPLHVLLAQPSDKRPGEAATLSMLSALLGAGADPDARWDGGRTMLMVSADVAVTAKLLEAGADPRLVDDAGDTALHLVKGPEAVRLLAAHGADVDAWTLPPRGRDGARRDAPRTPYQAHLSVRAVQPEAGAILDALVAAGADPLKRDGDGRSTLWSCRTARDAERLVALGLDPTERGPDGATLLMPIVETFGEGFAGNGTAVSLFALYQRLGLDINAANRDGTTVLHLAAERSRKADVALLLRLGADRTLRDGQGRLPADLVPPSRPEVRALLRG